MKTIMAAMIVVLTLVSLVSTAAVAANFPQARYDHKFHYIFSAGIQNGGDALQKVVNTGTGETIENLRAGGFFWGSLGVVMPLGTDSRYSVQTTAGYIYDEVTSNINIDDNATFQRATVELIPFYNFGRQRIGLGAVYHFKPKFEQTASIGNLKTTFNNALGGVIQYDVMYDQAISVGFRGMYIEYDVGGITVQAPSIDIHFNYQF